VRILKKANIAAAAIHGNKAQTQRQKVLKKLKTGELRVLVATDIAARGIDVSDLALVINYDLPNVSETYVHRIGRTGRASASGLAISFCDIEEKANLRAIERLIKQNIPIVKDHPFSISDTEVLDGLPETPSSEKRAPKQHSGNRRNSSRRRPNQQKNRRQDNTRRDHKPKGRQATESTTPDQKQNPAKTEPRQQNPNTKKKNNRRRQNNRNERSKNPGNSKIAEPNWDDWN